MFNQTPPRIGASFRVFFGIYAYLCSTILSTSEKTEIQGVDLR